MYLRRREMGLEASVKSMLSAAKNANNGPTPHDSMTIEDYYSVFLAFEILPPLNRLRRKYHIELLVSAYQTLARRDSI